MNAPVRQGYGTAALASRLATVMNSAATIQHTDVFARRERLQSAVSRTASRLVLEIGKQHAILIELEPGARPPSWVDAVLRSVSERWGTEPGWDSYGAKPTDIGCVIRLMNYLSAVMDENSTPPIITPLSDGGVQAEWHQHNRDLELVVPTGEPAHYYYYNAATNEEEEEHLEASYARVQQLISQF